MVMQPRADFGMRLWRRDVAHVVRALRKVDRHTVRCAAAQIAPVFAVSGQPLTPVSGEHFANAGAPGNPATHAELQTLFNVIGTPAWACIDAVPSRAWQRYLYRIPPKAPTLYRRFGAAGEVAVDLLARFLTFDPNRRCGAVGGGGSAFDPLRGILLESVH